MQRRDCLQAIAVGITGMTSGSVRTKDVVLNDETQSLCIGLLTQELIALEVPRWSFRVWNSSAVGASKYLECFLYFAAKTPPRADLSELRCSAVAFWGDTLDARASISVAIHNACRLLASEGLDVTWEHPSKQPLIDRYAAEKAWLADENNLLLYEQYARLRCDSSMW